MAQSLHRRLRTGLFYALRTAFRIAPMPETTRDKLRQRFLDRYSSLVPPGPKARAAAGTLPRRPYVRADERAIGYVPYAKGELPDPLPATLVAFYLPQFHTIPENDEWWGKGFTEWRNVTRALPQFEGHQQPKLPGDLGFYDLRNPEVMREQARLAREYGISAFCFYFYWFGGKTLLETPLRNWLADPTIDLKFCLCWANEKWTRTWDGRGSEILIDQKHSPEDDLAFIAHVAEYMRDPRYLRIDGKPMLLVYRPGLFPDIAASASRWRKWCLENGIGEIHLAYVQSFERPDPRSIGFDAAVEFPPNLSSPRPAEHAPLLLNPAYSGEMLDWHSMAAQFRERSVAAEFPLHRGVNPGWDNEARRAGRGRTFLRSAPRAYRDWLRSLLPDPSARASGRPFVFINAWNEWAEGAMLEPSTLLGHAYLQATREALLPRPTSGGKYACIIHAWYPDLLPDMLEALLGCPTNGRIIITTAPEAEAQVLDIVREKGLTAEVLVFENRGRDILPFLHVAQRLSDEGVDLVLKLHTKRTTHRADGDRWRQELVGSLLGADRVEQVLAAFQSQPKLGMVGPEGHLISIVDYVGDNALALARLNRQMGLPSPDDHHQFVAGSMFWIRLSALRPLLDTTLCPSDFEDELGQTDGTLAHALERQIAYCLQAADYHILSTSAIRGAPDPRDKPYPYAKPSKSMSR